MYTITLAHTELLFPLHFLKYQFKLFAHSHHRSLDETVLRCILQLSARYYWSLFFYCFPIKMNINVCLHIHVLVTLNIMESAYWFFFLYLLRTLFLLYTAKCALCHNNVQMKLKCCDMTKSWSTRIIYLLWLLVLNLCNVKWAKTKVIVFTAVKDSAIQNKQRFHILLLLLL